MDGLTHYLVILVEEVVHLEGNYSTDADDTTNTRFFCWAEDGGHAIEQAANAYPNCILLAVRKVTP